MDVFEELGIVLVIVEMAPTGRLTSRGQEKYLNFIETCKKIMTEETNNSSKSQSKSGSSSRCDSLVSGFSGFSFFAISENGSENGAGSRPSSRRNSISLFNVSKISGNSSGSDGEKSLAEDLKSSGKRNSFSVIDLNAEEDPNGSLSESDEDDEEENLGAALMPVGLGNSSDG